MKPHFIRKKLPSIEEMHRDWEINCLPPDAPRVQVVEMKKAFISGVASMFHAMKFDVSDIEDDAGVDYLGRLDRELVQFFESGIFKL